MKANAQSIRPNRPTTRPSTANTKEERAIARTSVEKANADIQSVQSIIDQLVVYAPVASQVYQRNVEPGEYVSPGVPLVTLIDLADVWIHFDLREDLVKGLKVGDRFDVRIPALADRRVTGRGQACCDQGRICELAGHACYRRFRLADVFDPRLPGPAGARAAAGDERLSRLAVTAMRPVSKPGFWLVAQRECQWLFHDRVALLLIFGVPLFAFVVLTTVFSHPVIRGLGVTVVDEDKSDASRALMEYVTALAEPENRRPLRYAVDGGAGHTLRQGDFGHPYPA